MSSRPHHVLERALERELGSFLDVDREARRELLLARERGVRAPAQVDCGAATGGRLDARARSESQDAAEHAQHAHTPLTDRQEDVDLATARRALHQLLEVPHDHFVRGAVRLEDHSLEAAERALQQR